MDAQPLFFRDLDASSTHIALIDRHRQVSYAELCCLADQTGLAIGQTRKLVFLEARNTIEAVCAYAGCLRSGHAIYLFNPGDDDRLAGLVALYNPNVIVRHEESGASNIVHLHDDHIPLHQDLAVLLSTSGSTGSPKLVKLSARNIDANARSIVEYLELDSSARGMASLKFAYSYGLSIIHAHLACGASLVLTDESVTSAGFWTLFQDTRATSFAGVPYTFEMLDRMAGWESTPGLKFATQAGGRLDPAVVKRTAEKARHNGWRFIVMYGQTEASPRMAYLPADLALTYPDCIGIAIPGGRFSLIDEAGQLVTETDTPGELIYSGPNIMMGYAEGLTALETDDTPPCLKTGDIAVETPSGLFRIVGRKSRFIKPFGVRLNLDDVQAQVRVRVPDAICTGTDEYLIIACSGAIAITPSLVEWLSQAYELPAYRIKIIVMESVPFLANGKIDYPSIIRNAELPPKDDAARSTKASKRDAKTQWVSIAAIYATLMDARDISPDCTFISLSGDSLSYVVISLAVEDYLGYLPVGWETKSVSELEALRHSDAEKEKSVPVHYLNASRVLMLLLGVPFHAAMIYDLRADMIIAAPERSLIATVLFTFTHSFRMFAYFFISGYLSMLVLRQTEISRWLKQQIKRLGLPVLMGAVFLSPLEIWGVALSPVRHGPSDMAFWLQQMTSPGPQWLAQRWFLVTLLCLAFSAAGLVKLYRAGHIKTAAKRLFVWIDAHPALAWWSLVGLQAPLGLGAAIAAKLAGQNAFLFETFEYRTLLWYCPSFMLGALLCLRPKVLNWYLRPAWFDYAIAGVLALVFIILNKSQALSGKIPEALNFIPCGMVVTRAFIALMFRFFNKPHAVVTRLTDASYVIYMWHIVFVLLFNDLWVGLRLNPLLSIALTTIGSFGCSWIVYLIIGQSKLLSLMFNGGPLQSKTKNRRPEPPA